MRRLPAIPKTVLISRKSSKHKYTIQKWKTEQNKCYNKKMLTVPFALVGNR